MTMVTAMVSPRARPRPRMTAPTMPMRALRRTPMRIISQRVAPSASTASRCEPGTAFITSRVSDEMMGRIMIARMTPAATNPRPVGFVVIEESRPAEGLDEQRVHMFAQNRHQDEDRPKAVDDAWNGSQQLCEEGQRRTQHARAHLGEKHGHADGQRNRQQQ